MTAAHNRPCQGGRPALSTPWFVKTVRSFGAHKAKCTIRRRRVAAAGGRDAPRGGRRHPGRRRAHPRPRLCQCSWEGNLVTSCRSFKCCSRHVRRACSAVPASDQRQVRWRCPQRHHSRPPLDGTVGRQAGAAVPLQFRLTISWHTAGSVTNELQFRQGAPEAPQVPAGTRKMVVAIVGSTSKSGKYPHLFPVNKLARELNTSRDSETLRNLLPPNLSAHTKSAAGLQQCQLSGQHPWIQ